MISSLAFSLLAVVALGMVATTAGLLRWAAHAVTALRAAVVLFLLLMMTGMLVGAAIYYAAPSTSGLVEGFWVASVVMSASVGLVFAQVLREARAAVSTGSVYTPAQLRRTAAFAATVVIVVIANELLMGWVFQRAAGGPVWIGSGGIAGLIVGDLVAPWFVFPMAIEMSLACALLGSEFPRPVRGLLSVQPAAMAASPPTLAYAAWVIGAAVASTAAMAVALTLVLLAVYRGIRLASVSLMFTILVLGAFGVMAAGLAYWALSGVASIFALGVVLQMGIFLSAIVRPRRFAEATSIPTAQPVSEAGEPLGAQP